MKRPDAEKAPEETQPSVYWHDLDSTQIASDVEWLTRCRRRLLQQLPGLLAHEATELASELGLEDHFRRRCPEAVAEELASADSDPFARLEVLTRLDRSERT